MTVPAIVTTVHEDERFTPFESIKRTRPDGSVYWSARDLMELMGYANWRNFMVPLSRAMKAANSQHINLSGNFELTKLRVGIRGPYSKDLNLSRYAALLTCFMCAGESSCELSLKAHMVSQLMEMNIPYVHDTETTVDGHLYVCLRKSGLVKIGRSGNPVRRLYGHTRSAAERGDDIEKSFVSAKCSRSDEAEQLAHERVLAAGAVAVEGVEVFEGVSFEKAVRIVNGAIKDCS